MAHSVLLDTSFFIRLLNDEDHLHVNAKGYFKYFLDNDIIMKISTISIAEYCVLGRITELPLKNIFIVPFNLDHAEKAGEFASIIFSENNVSKESLHPRAIIPNDSKLFAQADKDNSITHFVTSDKRSQNTFRLLKKKTIPKFEIIDISVSHDQVFGIIDFKK
jgi:predicted nucleic acid-binding protein